MPRGKRTWRRRWYYVDHNTERGIWELADQYGRSRPDVLHAVVKAATADEGYTLSLLGYFPTTPFHEGDETDGPTAGD